MKVVAKYSDGTQKVITNYTYSPTGALTENDKKIIITYLEGNIEKTAEIKRINEGNYSEKEMMSENVIITGCFIRKSF